jgi:uncharacterized protein (TIGR00255 family)
MIQSMTAFARTQNQSSVGNIVCELRSINHRYQEMSLRLPEVFQGLEAAIRERIRHHVKRGKIEFFLRYQPAEVIGSELVVNSLLVEKLCQANEKIATLLKAPALINTMEILKWPGVLQTEELDLTSIQRDVMVLVEAALISLVAAREREGAQLNELFLQRLDSMQEELSKVRHRLPVILSGQRERLLTRFREASLQLDTSRLEQELVLLAQKIDVTEEIERLDAHIVEVRRTLKQGEPAGRRLDFLMQEFNREANTLGSKSIDAETTRSSVELKVLIEQMREQVQNVE